MSNNTLYPCHPFRGERLPCNSTMKSSVRVTWWDVPCTRQSFIHEGKYLPYKEMDKRMQSHEAYKALPAKVSQQVLLLLHKNWTAFFEGLEAYKENPTTFTGRPRLPKYKHKQEGRNILVYTVQALSQKGLKDGLIRPSGLAITIE